MFQIIKPLSNILKIKKINVSDFSFILHTKLTVVFLILFSVILSAKEFFGTPIHCYHDDESKKSFLNDYCWTSGTFTYANTTGFIFLDFAYFKENSRHITEKDAKIYQRYYPWIVLVLIFEATLCYLPAFLWKIYENGLMSYLCKGLDYVFVDENISEHKRKIIEYFKRKNTSPMRTRYVCRFYELKLLICINVIINMLILDFVIPNFWTSYAPAVFALLKRDWLEWLKSSCFVFPKLAKCTFHNYGPSGSIQEKDSLCLLPLNMFNDKVFAFLWLWFMLLILESFVSTLHVLSIILSKTLRFYTLKRRGRLTVSYDQFKMITNNGSLGDWFLLYQMASNLNPLDFNDIVLELVAEKSGKTNFELEQLHEAKI